MSSSQNQTTWTYKAKILISMALQKVLKIANNVVADSFQTDDFLSCIEFYAIEQILQIGCGLLSNG